MPQIHFLRTAANACSRRLPAAGEGYPKGPFGARLGEIARLVKANVGLEIAFTEIEGWDTHVNEGGATGILANRLRSLADGISAFFRNLGDRMEDVVLVTLLEFGRTAGKNGNRGTDHGHANVMLVAGGKFVAVRSMAFGQGCRPNTCTRDAMWRSRPIFVRLWRVLARHLGSADLRKVFPGFTMPRSVLEWKV
jgi:hypothetical protein